MARQLEERVLRRANGFIVADDAPSEPSGAARAELPPEPREPAEDVRLRRRTRGY
jgi:hypothetical protein